SDLAVARLVLDADDGTGLRVVVDRHRVLVVEEEVLQETAVVVVDRGWAAPGPPTVRRLVEVHVPAGRAGRATWSVEDHGVGVALVVECGPDVAGRVLARRRERLAVQSPGAVLGRGHGVARRLAGVGTRRAVREIR